MDEEMDGVIVDVALGCMRKRLEEYPTNLEVRSFSLFSLRCAAAKQSIDFWSPSSILHYYKLNIYPRGKRKR